MHVMIDIETLDTTPSAVVLSAGWAFFDSQSVLASGQRTFDLNAQMRLGRTISPSTVRWWKDTPQDLPKETPGGSLHHFVAGMQMAQMSVSKGAPSELEGVWANSPSFDLVILRHWAEQLRLALPWSFRAERDFRTWRELAKKNGTLADVLNEDAHDARADAVWQAQLMIANRRLCAF